MQREYFDQLMQALLEQQQVWEQLKEENWQLRRQLTDLRAAQGVVVTIEGKRFLLTREGDERVLTTEQVAVRAEMGVRLPKREAMTRTTGAFHQIRPMALRSGSTPQEEPAEPANQEAKETLQRELAGSFLLTHEA